ncbi:ATP-binding protein [Mesorhizobium hawassense]|uniref:ATP-binding protein n=1 Tax=Mesorhizobium hawassense TaxID=1209954 RepID=UPI003CCAA2B9
MSEQPSYPPPGRPVTFGQVLSCCGSQATVGVLSSQMSEDHRATVGKFIAIRIRDDVVLGMITEVEAAPGGAGSGYKALARVDLMGEICRGGGSSWFRRGVREYPAIGDEAVMVSREDLKLIYSKSTSNSIEIGHLQQDPSIAACVDVDSMLSKHFAVLGSTGVGKSSGVAIILNEVMRARPDVRILLLDIHGEYGHSFGQKAHVFGLSNLRLPFWLFSFEEMIDVIFAGRPPVAEEVEILAELIPVAKATYMALQQGGERAALARKGPRHMGFTVDTPSPYQVQDLLWLIDERMGKLENRSTRMVHHRLMMRIEALKNDPRYAFMFESSNVAGDKMAAVLDQLFQLESDEHGITVLTLASLPGEVLDAVVCAVCRLAFEFGLWSEGAAPILIACEEAHRYAASDRTVGFAPARRALSRIAKEGRKYGVYLGLATQRPAELDPTIISQCSTLFVMRMANDEDQLLLRSALPDAAANLLSFVPSLGTGELIGIGEGMPLPARLSFRTLPAHLVPRSEQVDGDEMKQANLSRPELVRRTIERWRKATTAQPGPQKGGPREAGGPEFDTDAVERGLEAIASERLPQRDRVPLDPARYSILKR